MPERPNPSDLRQPPLKAPVVCSACEQVLRLLTEYCTWVSTHIFHVIGCKPTLDLSQGMTVLFGMLILVLLMLPVVAPRPVVNVGNKLGSWLTSTGIHSPHAGEIWNAYSSLSDGQTRQAFLRTLRSVVDYRGQAVSAINKLHLSSGLPILLIWGDQDRIIPVAHGYATHAAVPGSRLEVLPGVGHFPHVESPTAVVQILDDFIATTGPSADVTNQKS